MRKGWRWWALFAWWALAGSAVLALIVVLLLDSDQPREFAWEDYKRIQPGMTRADVCAALGCPPVDWRSGETRPAPRFAYAGPPTFGWANGGVASTDAWLCDAALISVGFDASGKVTAGAFFWTERATDNPLRNVLWRAKRRWQRWFP